MAGLPGVGGAGLALMSSLPAQQVRFTSDLVSARVEELQLTLGEGPCKDAYSSRRPVLVSDLDDAFWTRQWPMFAPAAVSAGARAVFALPLLVGAICLGVIDLYRRSPGALVGDDLTEALAFADAATELLLAESLPGGRLPGTELAAANRTVVHQATGMISAQLDVPIAEAFLRLRAHAFVGGLPLDEVAADVVARRLRFTVTGRNDASQ
ncbi:ANTAR domain-containing protein [Actinoplanes lutulentus]|uniref:ANTAR domain-containing protein n=1 Tax=Actinoplanes lutulentus TaxID=1287878 RepID=A0A327Z791_9ACTN|nr:ANTAR domain-containing protein [Actinoplanes lutulentus]